MNKLNKTRLVYGSAIVVLVLVVILMNVKIRQEDNARFDSKAKEETVNSQSTSTSKDYKIEGTTRDTRNVEEVGTYFVTNLFENTSEGIKNALTVTLPELEKGMIHEVKGQSKAAVSHVVVEDYNIVQESRHLLVSFTQEIENKEEQREVFLIIMETENGFKVVDFATEVMNKEP